MTPNRMAEIHAAAFKTQRPWSEAEFEELIKSDFVFQTAINGSCFALGRVVADEVELLTIATHPDQQSKGLARECLTSFLTQAESLGAQQAFLEVDAENAPALGLYTTQGFTEAARRTDYYRYPDGSRHDALILIKTLQK